MSIATKLLKYGTVAGAGAVAAYYLDPDRGRARRARSRDQLISTGRDVTRDVERQARYYEGRVEGARARADGKGRLDPVDDHVIKQAIEQALARTGVETSDVVIDVADGVAGLRGRVFSMDERKKIELETMNVPGVERVNSWLHLPGQTAPNKARSLQASEQEASEQQSSERRR